MIVESNDVYATKNPIHLAYQRRNRERGRMSGQIRFRVRYLQYATGYYDYLMVSPAEMREIVAGTGWRVARVLRSAGSTYFALLEKDGADGSAKRRGGDRRHHEVTKPPPRRPRTRDEEGGMMACGG